MTKVTEADVVNHYFPLIIQECKNSYKGIEYEDRIAEGALALLHAIRTYNKKYGEFKNYFLLQFKVIMGLKNKEAWAMKRLESNLSLDAPSIINDSYTGLDFLKSSSDDVTIIDVNCFIEGLSQIHKQVLLLIIGGNELNDISRELSVSVQQLQSLITQLQEKAIQQWL